MLQTGAKRHPRGDANGITVHAGWLIDGSGGPVRRSVHVTMAEGRIVGITDPATTELPAGQILDFSKCTLLPGLIDCHVHLCMSGTPDPLARKKQLDDGYADARETILRNLKRHLSCGVVAVRDAGDRYGFAQRFKAEDESISDLPVRIHVAGKAWHAPGRYGALIGRAPEQGASLARALLNDSDGIDHVKIVNSGVNSLIRYGVQTRPQFSSDELKAASAAADSIGLSVMVHANGVEPVAAAVLSGIHSIEHGFFMGSENLDRMRDRRVTWVPTAFAMKAFTDPVVSECRMLKFGKKEDDPPQGLELQSRQVAQRTLEHQIEQIRIAREKGVDITAGTDSGSSGVDHGESLIHEIGIFREAGFSIEEAIGCSTRTGARLMGIDGLGLLAPGAEATFAVVDGEPGGLPESLFRIAALFVKGRRVSL